MDCTAHTLFGQLKLCGEIRSNALYQITFCGFGDRAMIPFCGSPHRQSCVRFTQADLAAEITVFLYRKCEIYISCSEKINRSTIFVASDSSQFWMPSPNSMNQNIPGLSSTKQAPSREYDAVKRRLGSQQISIADGNAFLFMARRKNKKKSKKTDRSVT